MEFEISKTLYDKETILKVIYYYQDKFTINIILQEQQIRETLNKQFGDLRNSIYKKAFSFMEK